MPSHRAPHRIANSFGRGGEVALSRRDAGTNGRTLGIRLVEGCPPRKNGVSNSDSSSSCPARPVDGIGNRSQQEVCDETTEGSLGGCHALAHRRSVLPTGLCTEWISRDRAGVRCWRSRHGQTQNLTSVDVLRSRRARRNYRHHAKQRHVTRTDAHGQAARTGHEARTGLTFQQERQRAGDAVVQHRHLRRATE